MADVTNKTVKIYIDNSAAEFALVSLQGKADVFSDKIKKATENQQLLLNKIKENEAAGKDITKLQTQYSELGNKINAATKGLQDNQVAQKKLQEQIDSGVRPSLAQMERQVISLRNQLRNMREDAPGYAAKFESFKKAEIQLNSMKEAFNGVAKAQRTWMDEAKTIAFGVVIGNTVEKAIESITGYLGGIVSGNAKMSDSISQLKIYMHGTTEEAEKLYSSLKKIDTRTGNSELLDIATLVAKKGVAKEQIAGVTQALDQLFVVLGKEVGDPHEAVASLVKLVNVYSEDHHVTAENIGNIGAAIAKLTSSGVATGSFLISFAERLAGVRGVTGITIQSVLGMGAALEELGQKSESAGTAAQKLIIQMFLKPQLYAKAAGIEVSKFSEMLAKDPVEALIKVAGVLKQTKGAPEELIEAFKDMDISGARVYGVLGDIAGNADYMRKRLNDSSKAFGDTGFLMDAFKEKNTNLAAEVEKLGKVFNSLINSSTISDFFKAAVGALLGFVNVLKAAPKWMKENQTGITLIAIGLATMNAQYILSGAAMIKDTALRVLNTASRVYSSVITKIQIATEAAYASVMELVAGEITIATAAQQLWATALTLGAGPIGVIIVAIGALVIGIEELIGANEKLNTQQQMQLDVQQKMGEEFDAQKNHIEELLSVAETYTNDKELQKKAIDELIAQSPEYLAGLTAENITTQQGIDLINDYINSLEQLANAKALKGLQKDLQKDVVTKQFDVDKKDKEADKQSDISKILDSGLDMFGVHIGARAEFIKASEDYKSTLEELNSVNSKINENVKLVNGNIDVQTERIKRLKPEFDAAKKSMDGLSGAELATAKLKADPILENYNKQLAVLKNLQKERNIYLGLQEESNKSISNDDNKNADGLIAQLKAKIAELEKALPDLTTRKAIRENLALTKEYQKQLDELMGKTTKEHQDEILKELEAFKQKLLGIGKQADEREIDQINAQYVALAKKAAGHAKELIEIQYLKSKAIEFLLDEEERKRQEAIDKESTQAYKTLIGSAGDTAEAHKAAKAKEYADGLIDKKEYEAAILAIDHETLQAQLGIARMLSHSSKEAAADVLKYEKQINQEKVKDAIKTREEIDSAEKAANAYRAETDKNIMKLRLDLVEKGSDEELALKKENLRKEYLAQYDALLQQKKEHPEQSQNINTEIDLLGDKFDKDNKGLDDDHDKAKLKADLQYANETVSIAQKASDAISKIEDAQFNKWLKQQAREKTVIEQNAKSKLITGVEAQRQLAAADLEAEKKKQALEKRQFDREKAFSIAKILISGAEAIAKDLVGNKFMIPYDIATTAAEVAVAVAATPKYARGGALTGPSHESGGMPVINPRTGRKEAEVEGGEYILSKHTVRNNRAIADALLHSSMNEGGRPISLPWLTRPYRTLDYSGLAAAARTVRFAEGGVFPTLNNTPTPAGLQPPQIVNNVVVQHDEETKGMLATLIHRLNNPIAPNVNIPLTKLDDAYSARARIQTAASAS